MAYSKDRRTTDALVLPNPKEFFRMVCGHTLSDFTGRLSAAEIWSGSSNVALTAMKPSRIIRRQYTTSLAPAIQHSCPARALVDETGTWWSPKTREIAAASTASPTGVEVACAWM